MKRRLLPLSIKDRLKTELPALMALEAIGKPWFDEGHRCDILAVALIAQRLSPAGDSMHARAGELVALLDAPALQLDVLRPLVVELNAWLQLQPNVRIQSAIDELQRRVPG